MSRGPVSWGEAQGPRARTPESLPPESRPYSRTGRQGLRLEPGHGSQQLQSVPVAARRKDSGAAIGLPGEERVARLAVSVTGKRRGREAHVPSLPRAITPLRSPVRLCQPGAAGQDCGRAPAPDLALPAPFWNLTPQPLGLRGAFRALREIPKCLPVASERDGFPWAFPISGMTFYWRN